MKAVNERLKYPTISVRLTPEIKCMIEQLTQQLNCSQTALVIYALKVIKQNINDSVKTSVSKQIDTIEVNKKKKAYEVREYRNKIKRRNSKQMV